MFVDFGTLLGGDSAGYTDENGATYPDNEIDTEDLDQISDAYLAVEDVHPRWDDGVYNYKWCLIIVIDGNHIENILVKIS